MTSPHKWTFRAQGTPDEIRHRFHAHRRVYWHRTADPGEEGAIHHVVGHALAQMDPTRTYVVELTETDSAPDTWNLTLSLWAVDRAPAVPEGSGDARP